MDDERRNVLEFIEKQDIVFVKIETNIASSNIIIPAKYRENLELETMNKLAMNNDFKDFLETVKIDLTSRKIHQKNMML